MLTTHNKMLES